MQSTDTDAGPARAGQCHIIPEDPNSLVTLNASSQPECIEHILELLKVDKVILVQGASQDDADYLIEGVADALGLGDRLRLEAAFASSRGHRENVGKYYMTVDKRSDYQVVAPHSEGGSFTNKQLSSFFSYENTTDGGETILMNLDESCQIWSSLRELKKKGATKHRPLSDGEMRRIKGQYRLSMPEDVLTEDDEVLDYKEIDSNFTLYNVLTKPKKTYSTLLKRSMYVYWESIERVDLDSREEFCRFLKSENLLKLPPDEVDLRMMDDMAKARIRHFGSNYRSLFKRKLTRKLLSGDLIIQNNMTWCHSVSNWTPGTGVRRVVAAFA